MNNIEIMLVDDNEDDVIIFKEAFKETALSNIIHTAWDGEEALAWLRKEGEYRNTPTPDIVLLDINMPKKDCFEVLKEMKADPILKIIPVVMMTTSDREDDIVNAYANGAASYIRKPIDIEELMQIAKTFSDYWANVVKLPENGRNE